jgi:hypothetical protein
VAPPTCIPVDLTLDEWELIARTLDRAFPDRRDFDPAEYRKYEQLINKLHKARQEAR